MRRISVFGVAVTGCSAALAAPTITRAATTTKSAFTALTVGPPLRRWGYELFGTDRPALRRRGAGDRRLRRRHRRRAGTVRLRAVVDARRARSGSRRPRSRADR